MPNPIPGWGIGPSVPRSGDPAHSQGATVLRCERPTWLSLSAPYGGRKVAGLGADTTLLGGRVLSEAPVPFGEGVVFPSGITNASGRLSLRGSPKSVRAHPPGFALGAAPLGAVGEVVLRPLLPVRPLRRFAPCPTGPRRWWSGHPRGGLVRDGPTLPAGFRPNWFVWEQGSFPLA